MFKQWRADFRRLPNIDAHWFVVWFLLYVGFILLDFFFPYFWGSSVLKYTGVFLCLVYANKKYRDDTLLFFALAATFLADTILIWTDWQFFGVTVFCAAQFLHMLRLTKTQPAIIGLDASIVILVFLIMVGQGLAPLYAAAAIYALALICNVCLAYANYREQPQSFTARCAFYGFSAFLACDICVALRHLILENYFPATFLPLIAFLVWVFYYPSQILIANSSTLTQSHHTKIAKTSSIS